MREAKGASARVSRGGGEAWAAALCKSVLGEGKPRRRSPQRDPLISSQKHPPMPVLQLLGVPMASPASHLSSRGLPVRHFCRFSCIRTKETFAKSLIYCWHCANASPTPCYAQAIMEGIPCSPSLENFQSCKWRPALYLAQPLCEVGLSPAQDVGGKLLGRCEDLEKCDE